MRSRRRVLGLIGAGGGGTAPAAVDGAGAEPTAGKAPVAAETADGADGAGAEPTTGKAPVAAETADGADGADGGGGTAPAAVDGAGAEPTAGLCPEDPASQADTALRPAHRVNSPVALV